MRHRARGARRSSGEILRSGVPRRRPAEESSTPTAPARPSWGRRVLGVLLLVGTVTLVSCQSVFAALSPGLYD